MLVRCATIGQIVVDLGYRSCYYYFSSMDKLYPSGPLLS